MATGPKIEDVQQRFSTCDGLIQAFYEVTGRMDVEFGEQLCGWWWRPNIRMVDTFGVGRAFVAGGKYICEILYHCSSLVRCGTYA